MNEPTIQIMIGVAILAALGLGVGAFADWRIRRADRGRR
jgi:uncharacterized protein HemX